MVEGLATDPDLNVLTKAYADAIGLSISIKSQEEKDGAFSYGKLGMELAVVESAKLGTLGSESSKASTGAVLAALGSSIAARWTISNGTFLATSGDAAALEALTARETAGGGSEADPAFAAFAKSMPPKAFAIGSLSVRKLMKAVSGILAARGSAGGSSPPAMPDPSLFGSWYSYFAIDPRALSPGLEAGFFVPASDIGALVRSGAALFNSKPSAPGV